MAERCAEEALLSAWLDGELSRPEQTRVAAHLDACRPCAAQLARVRRVRAQLRSLPERQVPEGLFDPRRFPDSAPEPEVVAPGRGRTVLGGILVLATVLTLLASAGEEPPPRAVNVPVEGFVVDGHPDTEGPAPVPVLAPDRGW